MGVVATEPVPLRLTKNRHASLGYGPLDTERRYGHISVPRCEGRDRERKKERDRERKRGKSETIWAWLR